MPFTPFHFGVGIAAKAALPRYFSLSFFIALQVITDLESLYNLVSHRTPVHRFLHTFAGATLLAAVCSAIVPGVVLWWQRRFGRGAQGVLRVYLWLLATALFATWSHVVLDAVMHGDVEPFWPIRDFNPFLYVVPVRTLHLACLVLGFFGVVVLGFQWSLREKQQSPS